MKTPYGKPLNNGKTKGANDMAMFSVGQLYKSRYWFVNASGQYSTGLGETAVVTMAYAAIDAAKTKGLTLLRFQTNSRINRWQATITYVAVPATYAHARSSRSIPPEYPRVRFTGVEGQTVRCRAYRQLLDLLIQITNYKTEGE